MITSEHPCNLCVEHKDNTDCNHCVWSFAPHNRCLNYGCMFHREDSCLFGFDEKCCASTVWKGE